MLLRNQINLILIDLLKKLEVLILRREEMLGRRLKVEVEVREDQEIIIIIEGIRINPENKVIKRSGKMIINRVIKKNRKRTINREIKMIRKMRLDLRETITRIDRIIPMINQELIRVVILIMLNEINNI